MYPVAPYLAQQTHTVPVQHSRTSEEVEWALIIADDGRQLLTPPPTCSARTPWVLSEISDHLDKITLRSWVTNGGVEEEIQTGSLADLLPPGLWVEVLKERRLFAPGTIVLSGTLNMREGVNQFADHWRAEMNDPVTGDTISIDYAVEPMAKPIS